MLKIHRSGRRVAHTAIVYLASLALALGISGRVMWDTAMSAALPDYMYRPMIAGRLAAPRAAGPLIVWLGDSTLLEGRAKVAYPLLVTAQLRPPITSRVIAAPGVDSHGHSLLMGRVLALRPLAIVIVAHLRFLGDPTARSDDTHLTMNDLASYLALADIPTALRLPLSERHLTMSRLLLAQVLDVGLAEKWFMLLVS